MSAGASAKSMPCARLEVMLPRGELAAAAPAIYLDHHEPGDGGCGQEAEAQAKGAAEKLCRVLTNADENGDKLAAQDVGQQQQRDEKAERDEVATIDTDKSCSPAPSPLAQCKQVSAAVVEAVVGQVAAVTVAEAQTLAVTTKEFVSLLVLGENSGSSGSGGQENEPSRAQSADQQQQRRILSDGTKSVASDELIAAARPAASCTGENEETTGEPPQVAPRLETCDEAAQCGQQTGDFPPLEPRLEHQVGVIVTGPDEQRDYLSEQYYTDQQATLFYIGDEESGGGGGGGELAGQRPASPCRGSVLYAPQDVDVSGHCQGACCGNSNYYNHQDYLSPPPPSTYRGDGCSSSASNNSSNLSSQPGLVIDTDAASSSHTTADEFVPCSPEGYLLLGGSGGGLPTYQGGDSSPPSGQQLRARRESSLMCEAFEQSVLANDGPSSCSSSLGGANGAPSSGGGGRNSRQDTESLTTPPPASLMLLSNEDDKRHYYDDGDHFSMVADPNETPSSAYEIVPYVGGGGGGDGESPATCCSSEPARLDDHQYCTASAPYANWTAHAEAPQIYHHRPHQSHANHQYLPPGQQVAAAAQPHYQAARPALECQMRSNEDYRQQTSYCTSGGGQCQSQCASADAVVCHERGQQLIEWKPAEQQSSYSEQQTYTSLDHHQYGHDSYVSEPSTSGGGGQQDHYQQYATSDQQQQQYEPEKTHHLLESHHQSTSGQPATYDAAANQTYHESYGASNTSGYYGSSYAAEDQSQQYQQQGSYSSYYSYNSTIGQESYANYNMPIVSDHYDPSVELGSCLRQFELSADDDDDDDEGGESETSRSPRPASRTEQLLTQQSAETAASESARKLNQARAAAGGSARAAATTASAGAKQQEAKKVGCSKETIAKLRLFLERRMMLKEKQAQHGRLNMDGQYDTNSFSSYNSVQQTSASYTNRTSSFAGQPSTSGSRATQQPLSQAQPTSGPVAQVAPGVSLGYHVQPPATTIATNSSKKANSVCSESCVSTPASSCESNDGDERDIEDRLGATRRAASEGAPDHGASPKSLPVIVFQQQQQQHQRRPSLIVDNSQTRRRTRSRSRSRSRCRSRSDAGSEDDGRRRSSDFSGASSSSGASEGPNGERDVGVQTRASKRRRLQQQQRQQQQAPSGATASPPLEGADHAPSALDANEMDAQ